jgi:hypothetical protein
MGLGRRHRIDLALDRSPAVLATIQLAEVMRLQMPELFRGENETRRP